MKHKHTNLLKPSLLLSLLSLSMVNLSVADITMIWNKQPLNINVPVGTTSHPKQLIITFPERVRFGLPDDLQNKLSVLNNDKTLYLTANQSFRTHQNVMVQTQSGKTILINLSASKKGINEPIDVQYQTPEKTTDNNASNLPKISMMQLVRYAVQQLYAPKRLLKTQVGISQVNQFNGKAYQLFQDDSALTIPLASYVGGGYIVTAVLMKNMLSIPLNVDPNLICGEWLAVAPFPNTRLDARGGQNDRTTLFLVSRNDFVTQFKATCGVAQ